MILHFFFCGCIVDQQTRWGREMEFTPEWVAIELHGKKGKTELGTIPSLDRLKEWFEGAASLGDLPQPKWEDELRLVSQPDGTTLHTYRLGWIEVEPKPLVTN